MHRTTRLILAAPLLGMGLALTGCSHPNPGKALMQGSWKFERVVLPKHMDAQLQQEYARQSVSVGLFGAAPAAANSKKWLDQLAIRRYSKLLDHPILRFTPKAIVESGGYSGHPIDLAVKSYVHHDHTYTVKAIKAGTVVTYTYRLSANGDILTRQLENGFAALYRHIAD